MKKVSIKYKASDIRGKTVFITSEIEVPDFKPMKEDIDAFISNIQGSETWSTERINSFKKGFKSTYTIKEQIDDYIQSIDKSEFMYKNDLQYIIDWRVIMPKKHNQKNIDPKQARQQKEDKEILEFMDNYLVGEHGDIRYEFEAAYTALRKDLFGLPLDKKVAIISKSIVIAGVSVKSFIDRINEVKNKFIEVSDGKKAEKLKEVKEHLEMYSFTFDND